MDASKVKQFLENYPFPELSPQMKSLQDIDFVKSGDFDKEQIGYRIHGKTKEDITGQAPEKWDAHWYVIGTNYTVGGDPVFFDTRDEDTYALYTAMHGAGRWEAHRIAYSLDDYFKALQVFAVEFSSNRFLKTFGSKEQMSLFLEKLLPFTDNLYFWKEKAEGVYWQIQDGTAADVYFSNE